MERVDTSEALDGRRIVLSAAGVERDHVHAAFVGAVAKADDGVACHGDA